MSQDTKFWRREVLAGLGIAVGGGFYSSNSGNNDSDSRKPLHQHITPEEEIVEDIAGETSISGVDDALIIHFPEMVEFEPQAEETDNWLKPSEYVDNDFIGDCEDYTFFTTSTLLSKGIEAYASLGYIRLSDEAEVHALTEFAYDGEQYIMDVNFSGRIIPMDDFVEEYGWQPEKIADENKTQDYGEHFWN